MWKMFQMEEKTCGILRRGSGGPLFFWPFYPHEGKELQDLEAALERTLPGAACTVAAFQSEDWNRDLSPWEAPTAFGGEPFSGKGPDTLRWLGREYLPWIREQEPGLGKCYVMGYSLAGLFALWSLYETRLFDGAVCCSGSLWIDGWEEYVRTHEIQAPSEIYLSLGGKEEKTRNPLMAQVGERTRLQERILKADPKVSRCVLTWNPGGHFADSAARLAKGMSWMLGLSGNR